MVERCTNPDSAIYPGYGGRGIRICDRWRDDFFVFVQDMGPRPSARHQIDRIDNNGHYEPCNCRWATPKQNQRNKRNTRYLTAHGATRPVAEWAELLAINPGAILDRIARGWTAEDAVSIPSMRPSRRVS